jgi:hypothetical protein
LSAESDPPLQTLSRFQAASLLGVSSSSCATVPAASVGADDKSAGDEPSNTKMSTTKDGRPSSEGFHQEYIASLRYRNDLPPPEMPPKFLDIPHEGLERFLTPGFASNMARREEPNIDVDAEGGMPIDLVGIPGLHLGDESGTSYANFNW